MEEIPAKDNGEKVDIEDAAQHPPIAGSCKK
jgi:hypothetical protein